MRFSTTELHAATLRRARPDEAAALSALAWRSKAAHGYPLDWLALRADDLTVTPAQLADPAREAWVIETGRTLVGWGAGEVGKSSRCTYKIVHLRVEPYDQRRGHGRRLVEALLDCARAEGCDRCEVVSDPHAQGFYERCGFSCVGHVPSLSAGRARPLLQKTFELF